MIYFRFFCQNMYRLLQQSSGIILILCITSLVTHSQDSSKEKLNFDSIYYNIATSLSSQNMDQAILSADSLFTHSNNNLEKVRCLMLLATLHERSGNITDALVFAVEGEKLAKKINAIEWQIRIAGFLSTTFRGIGLLDEGRKFLSKAEEANSGSKKSSLIQMFLHQEKAFYEMEEGNYTKAINEIRKAQFILSQVPEQAGSPIFIATSFQILGNCYLKKDDFAEARHNLNQSLKALGDQETELKGFIYESFGELALHEKKYTEALINLNKAKEYAEKSDNYNLKANTYRNLSNYYKSVNNNKMAMEYNEKYLQLLVSQNTFIKTISNKIITHFENEFGKTKKGNRILFIVCAILILSFLTYIIFAKMERNKERKKFHEFFNKISVGKSDLPSQLTTKIIDNKVVQRSTAYSNGHSDQFVEEFETDKIEKESLTISEETENRLLKELDKWEKKHFFIQNDISLSSLSAKMQTNTKYLSYVINKHKGKDINNYINELRINYIIEKLNSNPSYLDYKISYLAQECGFSSHSKFTSVFKAITGISPSAFIHFIKTESNIM